MENMIKQIAKAMIKENNVEQLVALSYNEPTTEGDAIVLKAAEKAEQWLFYSQMLPASEMENFIFGD